MTRTGFRPGVVGGVLIAALVAGVTVLVTPGDPADARRDDGRHRRSGAASARTAEQTVPAPPRPVRSTPVARVVPAAEAAADGTGRSRSRGAATFRPTALADSAPAYQATFRSPVDLARTGSGAAPAGVSDPANTLVLYDSTGPYAWLGEAYGTLTANLVSHFGAWTAHPVAAYTAGELADYSAVIYVGSTYDEPLPVAFLDDVLTTSTPVVWIYDNIWQLTARQGDFATARGFTWRQFDFATVDEVRYAGTSLTRDPVNAAGIMDSVLTDPARAQVLGEAVRADGTTFPWAVRSGNLTYLGEVPFAYMTHDDRYLAFADLLFDVLAPATVSRHRALVRIEDVGPDSDPAQLRAIADYLASRNVPFTVAVYPRYRNPNGIDNGGVAEDYSLRRRPSVVRALKYMQSRGGTLLMHGYTHQHGNVSNPYDGVSGNDFEFYRAHVDAANSVIYDGPVANDSAAFVKSRVWASTWEFRRAGLATPTMFEFPHYAASATDYRAIDRLFTTRYDRGLYFPGVLSGGTVDHSHIVGQFFPYLVRDVYGTVVVPENIGNVEPEAFNNHPARLPADLVTSARRNLVVRDGVASLFYHPYLGTTYLQQVVEGVQGLGYTFVPAAQLLGS
ncbi:MAG: DUF2334 domain-containing protein [Dactylosporangium sp.]|nr:DUF2334 domain-containing protein [Dactylosporangium sp.]NNJ59775.1 DUF2334 domain-containing protein [Dactylosporangium sp.]